MFCLSKFRLGEVGSGTLLNDNKIRSNKSASRLRLSILNDFFYGKKTSFYECFDFVALTKGLKTK